MIRQEGAPVLLYILIRRLLSMIRSNVRMICYYHRLLLGVQRYSSFGSARSSSSTSLNNGENVVVVILGPPNAG